VDSSLVRFDRHEVPGDETLRLKVFSLVDGAFAQRRKMLRSALSNQLGPDASSIIESAGVDPTLRGEALVLEDFIRIAQAQ
jgi:16S rRNA (adenine1518-N6/adenine1519-N6)-dimethyltransferase